MSKCKLNNNIFTILKETVYIFFSNIDKFFVYMLFPVFGQIIGIALSFGLTLGFADKIAAKADSISSALLLILLLAIPGLLIFAKAFWDFMVAYVALNSMTEGAFTTGHVYDFKSHNEVATRRTFQYVIFLIALSLLMSLGSSIFLIIPGFILWIYFILVFQVFTFEPDLAIHECFKRSLLLVKGDWGRTFFLMLILAFFSVFLPTQGLTVIFDWLNLTKFVCSIFDFIGKAMPLNYINQILLFAKLPVVTVDMVSEWVYTSVLGFIVAGLTLPIRSICWSLWYKVLSESKPEYVPESERKARRKSKKDKYEDRN